MYKMVLTCEFHSWLEMASWCLSPCVRRIPPSREACYCRECLVCSVITRNRGQSIASEGRLETRDGEDWSENGNQVSRTRQAGVLWPQPARTGQCTSFIPKDTVRSCSSLLTIGSLRLLYKNRLLKNNMVI